MVQIYHRGIDQSADIPETALPHFRRAGWITMAERIDADAAAEQKRVEAELADQRAVAARQAASSQSSGKAAGRASGD